MPALSLQSGPPWLLALVAAVGLSAAAIGGQERLAPYLPTPDDVVDRMLRLAAVVPSDVVYDLGSGDGRILIAAARQFGARGVGLEIDPALIAQSRQAAIAAGVADRVEFRLQDVMTADISEATVVTIYLLAASNARLQPRLAALRPGSRIVTHQYPIGTWEPARVETFTDAAGRARTLLLYRP